MLHVEIEPTIPVFVRAKKVKALDRAATVVGKTWDIKDNIVTCITRENTLRLNTRTQQ
jgi:hypothetical protein